MFKRSFSTLLYFAAVAAHQRVPSPESPCHRLVFLPASRTTLSGSNFPQLTSLTEMRKTRNFLKQNHFPFWEGAGPCTLLKVNFCRLFQFLSILAEWLLSKLTSSLKNDSNWFLITYRKDTGNFS